MVDKPPHLCDSSTCRRETPFPRRPSAAEGRRTAMAKTWLITGASRGFGRALRAMVIEPGSFRTGIEHRTKTSGVSIDDYTGTAGGMFRAMKAEITPEMFPGDP